MISALTKTFLDGTEYHETMLLLVNHPVIMTSKIQKRINLAVFQEMGMDSLPIQSRLSVCLLSA